MEDLLTFIILGSFFCTAFRYIGGFDHDVIAPTRKKMLRLATVSLFVLVGACVLAVKVVI